MQCDLDWEGLTYHYCHLFDSSVTVVRTDDTDALLDWISKANNLQQDLKHKGSHCEITEVIHMEQLYGMVGLYDQQPPTTLNDILSIVRDRDWYAKDMEHKRGIIYMLAYGIFRPGYNQWALKASEEWMHSYKLAYGRQRVYSSQSRTTEGTMRRQYEPRNKGFVYTQRDEAT